MISEARIDELAAMLPEVSFVRQFVRWATWRSDCPKAFTFAAALSVLACNAPSGLTMHGTYGNFWGLLVGPSGSGRKSTALILAQEIQTEVEPKRIGGGVGSAEGLMKQLSRAPQQCLFYEEFGNFLASSYRTGDYFHKVRTQMTDLFDCQPRSRELAKSSTQIKSPRLSVFGGCTPVYIERYSDDLDFCGGFFGRFNFLYADSERRLAIRGEDPETKNFLVMRAAEINKQQCAACLGYEPAAKELWIDWFYSLDDRIRAAKGAVWAQTAARVSTVAEKAAMFLALDLGRATPEPWLLGLLDVQIAIQWAELHLESLQLILEHIAATPYARERRRVLRAIDQALNEEGDEGINMSGVTLRSIMRALDIPMPKRQVAIILDSLLAEGSLFKWAESPQELFHTNLRPPIPFGRSSLQVL